MRTAEEIALTYGLCKCDEAYTKRGLTAPDCPWHSCCVEEAMKEYAIEACKNQRQICLSKARHVNKGNILWIDPDSVLNAPLPELK